MKLIDISNQGMLVSSFLNKECTITYFKSKKNVTLKEITKIRGYKHGISMGKIILLEHNKETNQLIFEDKYYESIRAKKPTNVKLVFQILN